MNVLNILNREPFLWVFRCLGFQSQASQTCSFCGGGEAGLVL